MAGLAQPPARVLALGLILLSFCLLIPEFSWARGNLPAVTYARVFSSISSSRLWVLRLCRTGCPASLRWGKGTLSPWAATPSE